MKLRDYQEQSVSSTIDELKTHRSTLIILPTGCGKTVVFSDVIRRMTAETGGRAMILAHREELIRQAAEKVRTITGEETVIEMGEMRSSEFFGKAAKVVVSTVQTQNAGRMYEFDPAEFTCLVIDEAHHATSKSYRACIDHYFENPNCRLVGVTATPDRADEYALGTVFESVAFEYTVTQAIEDGWLVPIRQKLVKVGSLDFSGISTTAGDFNQGELSELMQEEENLHGIAKPTVEICGTRRAIVFATSVKQAERLAEILNRYAAGGTDEGGRAAWICGKTPKDERRQTLEDFKAGRIQYVVNCGVLTEGFDDAGVEVVVMARPTQSRALYSQMAGRCVRPAAEIAAQLGEAEDAAARRKMIAESAKPGCLIVDFVGNSGRHKLVTTADVLGGKDDDEFAEEARERAKKHCVESGEETDIASEITKARAEIVAEKERAAKRRAFLVATAKYVEFSVDPFNVFDLPPVEELPSAPVGGSLTLKQRDILREKLKVDPDGIGAARGRQLLNEHFRRIKGKLATLNQLKFLRRRGIPVPMTYAEASKTIGRMVG